jgi:hypothetical protein
VRGVHPELPLVPRALQLRADPRGYVCRRRLLKYANDDLTIAMTESGRRSTISTKPEDACARCDLRTRQTALAGHQPMADPTAPVMDAIKFIIDTAKNTRPAGIHCGQPPAREMISVWLSLVTLQTMQTR